MQQSTSLSKIVRSQSLEEKVYQKLKEAILNCALPPGAPFVETRQAEELGVSRTPIRKAIARLEDEGFLTATPNKGYKVSDISIQDLREIYEIRDILECHILRETVGSFSGEELDQMELSLTTAAQALERGDYRGFLSASRGFHHVFIRKYGNQRVSDLLGKLDQHVHRNLMVKFSEPDRLLTTLAYREHRLILDAVRDGDVELAVSLMREHLRKYPTPMNRQQTPTPNGKL